MLAAFFSVNALFKIKPIGKHNGAKDEICKPEGIHLLLQGQKNACAKKEDAEKKPGPDLLVNSQPYADNSELFKTIGHTFKSFFKFHAYKLRNVRALVQ